MAEKRVTRDVEPSALPDLLDHPARATVAFVDRDRTTLLPARARLGGGRHRFALDAGAPALDGHEVVLVVDDGSYWFELRGISVRGMAVRAGTPETRANDLVWYAVEPRRVLAWDYGTIREV
jgi:hypothetical protein